MPEDARPDAAPDASPDAAPVRSALPWLLVVASTVPLVLAAAASRTWFSGARDAGSFSYDPATDLTPGVASVSFADRWASFADAVPFAPALLAATLGVVVLAALTLAGRPAWLAPTPPARRAAAAVAALTSAASAGLLVAGVVAAGTAPVTTSSGGQVSPTTTADLVDPLGVGLLTGLLAACACALLAHPPTPSPAPVGGPRATTEPTAGEVPHDVVVAEDVAPEEVVAPAPTDDFPRPAPGQLDRYRRT